MNNIGIKNNSHISSQNPVTTEKRRTSPPDQKTQRTAPSVIKQLTQQNSERTEFDNNSELKLLNQPIDMIHEILFKLSIHDILNFVQTCKQAKTLADITLSTKKIKLQIALKETNLETLFEMVNVLYKRNCLPKSKVAYVKKSSRDHKAVEKEIDLEGTLLNLKNFTISDLISTYKGLLMAFKVIEQSNNFSEGCYNEYNEFKKGAFNRFKTFISKFPVADIEQIDDDDVEDLNIKLNKYHIKIKLNDDGKKAFWDFSQSIEEPDQIQCCIAKAMSSEEYDRLVYYEQSDKFLAGVVRSIKESKPE